MCEEGSRSAPSFAERTGRRRRQPTTDVRHWRTPPPHSNRKAKWDDGLKEKLSIEFGKCGCNAAFGLGPSWGLFLALLLSLWSTRLLGLQD